MIRDIILQTKLYIRKILSILIGKHKELNKLSKLPRYTPGKYSWKRGATLEFPDAASFVSIYKGLFIEQIYKFNTEKKNPLIIDCGANMGLSVIYCKELYPDAKVIAFEPERTIHSYLQKNVHSLGLKDVQLVSKAVWSKNETLMFRNEGADASRIASGIDKNEDFSSTYEVEAVRLSEFIDREVDFLKLDIEGAEVEVMKEIEPKLRYVKNIFVEYHSFEKSAQELNVLLDILSRNNFHYYIDSPNRMKQMPFVDDSTFLSMDFFLHIYATRQA